MLSLRFDQSEDRELVDEVLCHHLGLISEDKELIDEVLCHHLGLIRMRTEN